MKLNLKALGLALVAMFAMSAVAASSASAEFTAPAGATITGVDEEGTEFEVTETTVTCKIANYDGQIIEGGTSVTVSPEYTECTAFGAINAKVTGFTHNDPAGSECHFVLDTDGSGEMECAEGGEVTVEAATCVVHIPPQEVEGITYTKHERENHDALTLDINITGIKANHTDGFLCPMTGSGEGEEGVLRGAVTAWAEDVNGNTVDLTHHEAH